ncbi:IS3 family transposase [Streptomyces goshikiensis]|uniref:IS3 family transposase n=1 Tax=Streptomyces goshikiensis TaxID=1942 RepID=UPI00368AB4B9
MTEAAVRDWVRQAAVGAGERDGLTSSEREELAALGRENRGLREDVEVLKGATAFFARRPGERASVHRRGENCGSQRQTACGLLQVSRTASYTRRNGIPGPRRVRDAELTEETTIVRQRSRGTYGAPRVHAVLKREGTGCGRRRVARLMRQAGLAGRTPGRRHRTTVPDPHASTRADLVLRDFQPGPAAIGTRGCGDIAYIATEEGWLCLATVIDSASRRVVGWATADHLRTELVADTLTAACRTAARRAQ